MNNSTTCPATRQKTSRLAFAVPNQKRFALAGVLATIVALGGCASSSVDDTRYTRVESNIREAKEVQASDLAGAEIYAAQKKLAAAKKAEKNGNIDKAVRILREAELHAELAQVRSMAASQEKALHEVNAGLATLERELKR